MLKSRAKVLASIRRPASSGILPMRSDIRRSAALSLSFVFNSVPGDETNGNNAMPETKLTVLARLELTAVTELAVESRV